MDFLMDLAIGQIHRRSMRRVGALAGELVEAPSEEKEMVLAELEFERWLADYCAWCMEG